ncbi:MAG: DUF2569 family protein [Proteobacteria bacterium]|nr:DUF2569 family protein [Pseudomonadota bacterium]
MNCPKCGIRAAKHAISCFCGYEFIKSNQETEPEASPDVSPEASEETPENAYPSSSEADHDTETYDEETYDEPGSDTPIYEEEEQAQGAEQNKAAETVEQSAAGPTEDSYSDPERYDRVGGWLLLLCVLLTVLGPLATAYSLIAGYGQLQGLFEETPGLRSFYNMNFILNIGLGLFSLWAGFSLWTRMAGAVERAKNYLLARVAYSVILYFLPTMSGLPEEMSTGIQSEIVAASTFSFIYIAIWYLYLTKSKRVRGTYQS